MQSEAHGEIFVYNGVEFTEEDAKYFANQYYTTLKRQYEASVDAEKARKVAKHERSLRRLSRARTVRPVLAFSMYSIAHSYIVF